MANSRPARKPSAHVVAHHGLSITYYSDGTWSVHAQHRAGVECRYSFELLSRSDGPYLGRRVAYADLHMSLKDLIIRELELLGETSTGQLQLDLGL